MSYRLFLDDVREPADLGLPSPSQARLLENSRWVVARTCMEAQQVVMERGCPDVMSLDYELGIGETGADFLMWFVAYDRTHHILPEDPSQVEVKSHSSYWGASRIFHEIWWSYLRELLGEILTQNEIYVVGVDQSKSGDRTLMSRILFEAGRLRPIDIYQGDQVVTVRDPSADVRLVPPGLALKFLERQERRTRQHPKPIPHHKKGARTAKRRARHKH